MSTIGRKKFRDYSSADEERNEKRVPKRQNAGRKGRYSSKNKSAWPDLLQNLEAQLLDNKMSRQCVRVYLFKDVVFQVTLLLLMGFFGRLGDAWDKDDEVWPLHWSFDSCHLVWAVDPARQRGPPLHPWTRL
jgi:hypothetical protein